MCVYVYMHMLISVTLHSQIDDHVYIVIYRWCQIMNPDRSSHYSGCARYIVSCLFFFNVSHKKTQS